MLTYNTNTNERNQRQSVPVARENNNVKNRKLGAEERNTDGAIVSISLFVRVIF